MIPVGRTVIVPANASLSNVVLTPQAMRRLKRIFEDEKFDIVHLHEPMAPLVCLYTLAVAPCPIVVTAHSSGGRFYRIGRAFWHVLPPRIDYRIAVSEQARSAAAPTLGGPFEILPNGVALPENVNPGEREHRVVFVGRHEPRKGLQVLLQAWPQVAERTGARLRLVGADPLAVRFLLRRMGMTEDGIDILGTLPAEERDRELLEAKVLAAPAIGAESFGMVLTEAFACATPVVASDIPGYQEVASAETGIVVPPGDVAALAAALIELLEDEPRRRALGAQARAIAEGRYSWVGIATRLVEIYEFLETDTGEVAA